MFQKTPQGSVQLIPRSINRCQISVSPPFLKKVITIKICLIENEFFFVFFKNNQSV